MLAHSSNHSRTGNSERYSIPPHIDRCRNLPVQAGQMKNIFCLNFSAVIGTKSSRFAQAAPAEVSSNRHHFRLLHVAASRRNRCVVTRSVAGKLTRPAKSRGQRITFTKTSPQQTDPPAR